MSGNVNGGVIMKSGTLSASTSTSTLPQALGKALLDLRAEMTAMAEQQIISSAVQREESLNVQMLVDKHTKELKVSGPPTQTSL